MMQEYENGQQLNYYNNNVNVINLRVKRNRIGQYWMGVNCI